MTKEKPPKQFYYGFALVVPKNKIPKGYIEEIKDEMDFIPYDVNKSETDILIPKFGLKNLRSVHIPAKEAHGLYMPPQIRQWRLFKQEYRKIYGHIDSFFGKPKIDVVIIFYIKE